MTKTTLLALKEKYISKQLKKIETMLKDSNDEQETILLMESYKEMKEIHKQINQILERQILP